MSLALVQVSTTDFQQLYSHLATHTAHRNMHLRQRAGRKLRYLHALYANASPEVEGMISGPGLFWHYKLTLTAAGQTQLSVLAHQSSPRAAARIQRRFLPEIVARMHQEQQPQKHFPRYLKGQFYLRRSASGMVASHAKCQMAVSNGVLDQRFVSQLQPWRFELLNP